jgi:hypothetical protein
MGVAPETSERLGRHAGLVATERGTWVDELLYEREPTQEEFDAAMTDLLQTLQALNVELNGSTPSGAASEGSDQVPRTVAYAVSEISDRLRRRNRPEAAQAVDIAWNAVLAGDIDDIATHVRYEARTSHS